MWFKEKLAAILAKLSLKVETLPFDEFNYLFPSSAAILITIQIIS